MMSQFAAMPGEGYRVEPHPCGGGWVVVVDESGAIVSEHKLTTAAAAKVRRLNAKLSQ